MQIVSGIWACLHAGVLQAVGGQDVFLSTRRTHTSSSAAQACKTGDAVDAIYDSDYSGATIHSFNSDGTVTVDWDDGGKDKRTMPWANVFHKDSDQKCYREDEGQMVDCAVGDKVYAKYEGNGDFYGAIIHSLDADGKLVVDWEDGGTEHKTVEPSTAYKLGGLCSTTYGVTCSVGAKVSAVYLSGDHENWYDNSWYDATIHGIKSDHGKDAMGAWHKTTITVDWSDGGSEHREVACFEVKKGDKSCSSAPPPSPPPPHPSPSPAPTHVFMPDCSKAASNWPVFKNPDDLKANSEWANYFTAVYGGVPHDLGHYPICPGAFTQIAVRGGLSSIKSKNVKDSNGQCPANDGDLVNMMSECCDPADTAAHYIVTSKNIGFAIPSNHWFEVQHAGIEEEYAWYYLTFGSAVWLNTGKTKAYTDHPQGTQDLLKTSCVDNNDAHHTGTPPTECEQNFAAMYPAAKSQGLDTIQFTHHYDCHCGTTGHSSIPKWNHLCPTEVIDLNSNKHTGTFCRGNYKAGWAAAETCDCQGKIVNGKNGYTTCKHFGLSPLR